jgi:hypothetical protein
MGFIINCWDGIYLYLETANKFIDHPYTTHEAPRKWAHAHYSPHLLSDEHMWAHSCDKPLGEEQVPPEEDYYDEI